jgi:hypothetical protein
MRRALLLGVLTVLGMAGAAYAAATVTNHYTVHAKITPIKSGTKAHPVPISSHLDWATTATPKGDRPNTDKTIDVRVQGIRENTNDFPACGTARLNDPSEGPTTCPAGSKVGTGFFIAEVSAAGDPSKIIIPSCRAELTIYNGGNHDLSFYGYKGAPVSGQPAPCPLPRNEAWNGTLTRTPKGLVLTATLPADLRHPPVAGTTFDSSAIKASFDIPTATTKVKPKGKKRTKAVKVGLFESISCPANHQRQLAVKFTQENGKSTTVTRLVPCR